MQTFPAQVNTGEHALDVVITIDEKHIAIDSGQHRLGRWTARKCTFERTAPRSYRFHTDQEWVSVQILDDSGFRQALALLRAEHVPLVPRPLLWMGAVAAVTAILVSTVTSAGVPAEAQPEPEVPAPTTGPPTPPPVAVDPTPSVAPPAVTNAQVLLERWNDIAARTPFALDGPGVSSLRGDHTVTVSDGTIVVAASPTGGSDQARDIMTTLGLAIAAIDPAASPAERTYVLANLGLDVDGENPSPIDHRFTRHGVTYDLSYEPGKHIVFSAGLEW